MANNWEIKRDENGLAWLWFDKAESSTNTLSGDVMVELDEKLQTLEDQPPKALVIASAKKNGFIAGADIKEFTGLESPAQAFDLIRRGQLVLDRLEKMPYPTVAAVHGCALGGGLEVEEAGKLALTPPGRKSAPFLQKLLNLPVIRGIFSRVLVKQVSAKARKDHYPAPYAIIDLWKQHIGNPDEMYLAEAHSIAELMTGETARNLVRVFLLQDRLKGLGNKKDFDLKHVHVVGAGTMGGDIAAWCAYKGFDVTLQDREAKYIEPALKRAKKLFEKKYRGDQEQIDKAIGRLQMDVDGNGVKDADMVIEAIFENVEAKQELYRKLKQDMKPEAVLATNTSSIRLETLATALDDPERLVGVHFFNPVAKMPLVEDIHTDNTDQDTIKKALAFTRHIDRLPVPCKSSPGFLVNRILMPYLMQAMKLAEEGVALEAIDKAAKDYGMPMGPVELADTVGLDVCLSVAGVFEKELGATIPQRLKDMVDAGKLGRKSGEGFYSYGDDGKPEKDRSKAYGGPSDLQDRLIYPMLNEAVAVLREGVVEDSELLDGGVIFGTGFAPFRGGPINAIKSIGQSRAFARQQELHDQHGDDFKPDAGWESLKL